MSTMCQTIKRYLVADPDGIKAPRVLNTYEELEECLKQWADAAGYASFAEFLGDCCPDQRILWFEIIITGSGPTLQVTVKGSPRTRTDSP
ncbi:MAG: hypothetical protein KKA73_08990 [Chloroflexi bacterium]|nr:hypothetical protein [Chloroflexota bacterium]MBU1747813.1 hypothetical protein [Chloroflexota bacterium]